MLAAQRVDDVAAGGSGSYEAPPQDAIPGPAPERSPSHLNTVAQGGVQKKTGGRRSEVKPSSSEEREPPVRRTGWSADEKQNLAELVDEIKPSTSEDWAVCCRCYWTLQTAVAGVFV